MDMYNKEGVYNRISSWWLLVGIEWLSTIELPVTIRDIFMCLVIFIFTEWTNEIEIGMIAVMSDGSFLFFFFTIFATKINEKKY